MSISGLHVTMFAWLAAALVGWLWRRSDVLGWPAGLLWPAPQVALVGGLVLAMAYAVFSGWGVPSQRTVWMLATVGLLRWSGRRWPWPLVWLLACAVVLAIDPWALLQAGFWLSFVAVGVLFATDGGADDAVRTGLGGHLSGLGQRGRAMLREQMVVTLALTPLTLLLFQQVSVVGLAANLLAIPWVTLAVTPLSLLGLVAAPIWDAAGWAIAALAWLLRWLATWPWATVSVAAASVLASAAGVLGGVLLVMRLPWGARLLGIPLLLPVLLWQAPRPAPGQFELLVADIGQGNAVLVRTATHSLVFDTGPRFGPDSDAGHLVLVPLLRALGERIDTVIVSHRDSDHSGGAEAVLAMQPEARFLTSIEATHPLHKVRPIERCLAGQGWNWDGVAFDILHPQPADFTVGVKPNAISCVLRIGNGAQAALLVGDIEKAQESRLVAEVPTLLAADVLLVPHHGSKTSSTPAFIDAVRPRFALVQAGYRNRFGHPAPPVAQRYDERQVTLVDSAHCGAMRWSSADAKALACERDVQQKYWQHRLLPRANVEPLAKKPSRAGDSAEETANAGIR
jgi:competence protein ComEC